MCLSKKGGKSLSGEIWEIHVPFKKGWQKFEWRNMGNSCAFQERVAKFEWRNMGNSCAFQKGLLYDKP